MSKNILVLPLFIWFFFSSCSEDAVPTYKVPDRSDYYGLCYTELIQNDGVRNFVESRKSGALVVFNTTMCNLCQEQAVKNFKSSIRESFSNLAIVILANDSTQALEFTEMHNLNISDSVIFVSTKTKKTTDYITKEMVAYEFEKTNFKNFIKP